MLGGLSPGGGGGVLDISLGMEVRPDPAPYTLILCKTKIADFPTSVRQNFDFHTLFKTFVEHIYAQAVYRPRKDTLFKTKIDKIDTLFETKIPKNIPWLAARPR